MRASRRVLAAALVGVAAVVIACGAAPPPRPVVGAQVLRGEWLPTWFEVLSCLSLPATTRQPADVLLTDVTVVHAYTAQATWVGFYDHYWRVVVVTPQVSTFSDAVLLRHEFVHAALHAYTGSADPLHRHPAFTHCVY